MHNPSNLLLFACELLLKSSVILLASALAACALRRSSAALRHAVWSAALFGILLVPLLSLFSPRWAPALISASRNAPIMARLDEGGAIVTERPLMELKANADAVSPMKYLTDWRFAVVGIWSIGVGLLIFQRGLGSLRLRLLRKSSPLLMDPRVKAISSGVLAELRIERAVELRTSSRTLVPITWGTQHPVLLLPMEALSWSDEHIDASIRHEAAHIARHDYATNFIAQIACAFYWPNPLAWLALRSLHTAQEQAADDLVIRAGTVPERYACQLLDLARKLAAQSGSAVPYSVAMARRSTLESRMLAIMDEQRNRCPISLRTATNALVPVLLALALCSMTRLIADENSANEQPGKGPTAKLQLQAPGARAPVDADPFEKLVIDQVELTDVTLTEAADILRSKARALGADSFDIVIPKMSDSEPRLTLSLKKVPVAACVQYIARALGMQVLRKGDVFQFVNMDSAPAHN